MRQLVTIRTISALSSIPWADRIELAQIDGWQVVVRKGEFEVGSQCLYFEIDSILPADDPRFAGFKEKRIRTSKIRGVRSQGIAMPLDLFPEIIDGRGLAEQLGVTKYEAPAAVNTNQEPGSPFPDFIPKTDQERIQNCANTVFADREAEYEVTLKLDGCSFTAWFRDGEIGVCSRNRSVDPTGDSVWARAARDTKLLAAMRQLNRNIAVQAELIGPGIQGNREGLDFRQLYVFDVWDIDRLQYLTPSQRRRVVVALQQNDFRGVHVPVLVSSATLDQLGLYDVQGILASADCRSLYNPVAEGLVFKRTDGRFSFKAISNRYLDAEG